MPGPGFHASSWTTTPAAGGYSYLAVVCQQTFPLHATPAIAESELAACRRQREAQVLIFALAILP
jgi:hypothetical protein